MALKLMANYSKRLGLPGYSSHQLFVSVKTQITNVNDVREESTVATGPSFSWAIMTVAFPPGAQCSPRGTRTHRPWLLE
jgi:hypothetical protein